MRQRSTLASSGTRRSGVFSRRRLLGGLAAAAGALAARLWARARTSAPETSPASAPAAIAFRQPMALKSAGGELAVTLRAAPAVVEMGAERPIRTWAYDGVVPGHTWEVAPGDTLRIELVNDLPPLPHADHGGPDDLTRPHAWTTTNLHTHGMHVSPSGNADNVFLEIAPGESFRYEIPIPEDHPGGLFWYHPHKHGAAAQQLRGGMAGAIVVRGAIDEVPEVRAAREHLMVLQTIDVGEDWSVLPPIPHPSAEEAFFPRKRVLYTVNGVQTPTIRMHPGEVQRWRMVSAAAGKFMSLPRDARSCVAPRSARWAPSVPGRCLVARRPAAPKPRPFPLRRWRICGGGSTAR